MWKCFCISIHCSTSSLFCWDFVTLNLLIRNKDYVSTELYFPLISPSWFSSAEFTCHHHHHLTHQGYLRCRTFWNTFLPIWMKYVPNAFYVFNCSSTMKDHDHIPFVLFFPHSKSQYKTYFHKWINWNEQRSGLPHSWDTLEC